MTAALASTSSSTAIAPSKFRARKLDHHKALKIYDVAELRELGDEGEVIATATSASVNRPAPLVATGVDKEEEEEEHLQAALSSALVAPKAQAYVIPTPKVQGIPRDQWEALYPALAPIPKKPPKTSTNVLSNALAAYSLASSLLNEYAANEEDMAFCQANGLDVSLLEGLFTLWEEAAGRLSANAVGADSACERYPHVPEPTLTMLHEHWRQKRMPTLLVEDADPNKMGADPYVCFRRRELRLPRKTRRSDAQCLDKLRKMRYELETLMTGLGACALRDELKLRAWEQDQQLFTAYMRLAPAELLKAPPYKLVLSRRFQPPDAVKAPRQSPSRKAQAKPPSGIGGFPSTVDIVMEVEGLLDKMRLPPPPRPPRNAAQQTCHVQRDQLGRIVIERPKALQRQPLMIIPGSLTLKECALLNTAAVGNYNHHYVQSSSGLVMPLSLSSWMHVSREYGLTPEGSSRRPPSSAKKLKSGGHHSSSTNGVVAQDDGAMASSQPITHPSSNIGSNNKPMTNNITVKVKSKTSESSQMAVSSSSLSSASASASQEAAPTSHASFFTATGLTSTLSTPANAVHSSLSPSASNYRNGGRGGTGTNNKT
jgi:hypothetical protein